jgi:hypothetical protein
MTRRQWTQSKKINNQLGQPRLNCTRYPKDSVTSKLTNFRDGDNRRRNTHYLKPAPKNTSNKPTHSTYTLSKDIIKIYIVSNIKEDPKVIFLTFKIRQIKIE